MRETKQVRARRVQISPAPPWWWWSRMLRRSRWAPTGTKPLQLPDQANTRIIKRLEATTLSRSGCPYPGAPWSTTSTPTQGSASRTSSTVSWEPMSHATRMTDHQPGEWGSWQGGTFLNLIKTKVIHGHNNTMPKIYNKQKYNYPW